MDDTLKLGAVIVTLVGALGGVMAWLTRVLVPKLLAQFENAQAAFTVEAKEARAQFLDALREQRAEERQERHADREVRHNMSGVLRDISGQIALLNERLGGPRDG